MKNLSVDFSDVGKSAVLQATIKLLLKSVASAKEISYSPDQYSAILTVKGCYWFSNTATRREWYHGTI